MDTNEMNERARWEQVQQTVTGYCKQIVQEEYKELAKQHIAEVLYSHYAGYPESDGYYYVEKGDRGELRMGCQTTDETEMLFYIMKDILRDVGMRIELKNRADEQKKYDSRKMWFEYNINGLAKFFQRRRCIRLSRSTQHIGIGDSKMRIGRISVAAGSLWRFVIRCRMIETES